MPGLPGLRDLSQSDDGSFDTLAMHARPQVTLQSTVLGKELASLKAKKADLAKELLLQPKGHHSELEREDERPVFF